MCHDVVEGQMWTSHVQLFNYDSIDAVIVDESEYFLTWCERTLRCIQGDLPCRRLDHHIYSTMI